MSVLIVIMFFDIR